MVAPTRLFAGFGREAPWFDVLAVATLVAVVAALFAPAEPLLEASQNAVNRRGAPVTITSSPEEIVRWGRYLGAMAALAGRPIIAFLTAGLLWLCFGILGSGRASYRQYLAVAAHALLVPALGMLLLLATRAALGAPQLEFSLALAAPGADGFVRRLLELLDPFVLWMLALLALGARALDPRRSLAGSLAVVVGAYLALALGVALLPA